MFWLEDLLPVEVASARVLSYGYDSRTHGSTPVSDQYIWQHANALISDLTLLREETEVRCLSTRRARSMKALNPSDFKPTNHFHRPQSWGFGCEKRESSATLTAMRLTCAKALIHADSARAGHLLRHHAVKSSTYGLIFIGTPHQGGNGVQLGKVLVNVASAVQHVSHNAVKHLAKHSEWLQQQQSQYLAISADFDTVCFYETYKTPLPGLGHLTVCKVL